MGFLPALFGGRRHERAGFSLYAAAVAAARDPFYYRDLGVPDTLDGRFDMVGLFAFLVIHRLKELPTPGPTLAQAVFDAMFADMDINLREIGVGDLSVGKKVRAMWEAFHGRAKAYQAALETPGNDALSEALARNVWRGSAADARSARLAAIVRTQRAALADTPAATLANGDVTFVPAAEAAAR